MMTEQDWKRAWGMYCAGLCFAEIERHFGLGHTTVAKNFERRGWYDRSSGRVLVQTMPADTTVVVKPLPRGSWSPKQVFVAEFLAARKRPLAHIAEVVNQPVEAVKELLAA